MPLRPPDLIHALRETAQRLDDGARYEWGHMGRCNCGHLVQTLTRMTDREIVASIDHRLDEWSEHAVEYCEGTDTPVDALFEALLQVGFTPDDVRRLEYLSDRRVLRRLGDDGRRLRHNDPADAARYMNALADVLEEDGVSA